MQPKQDWTYCVTGHIKETHIDENGVLRHGTSAFRGGTKVYLSGRTWDRTRNCINVISRTRKNRFQVIWTDISLIENLRCQRVYEPVILRIMRNCEFQDGWWGKSKKEKEDTEAFVRWWNQNIVR